MLPLFKRTNNEEFDTNLDISDVSDDAYYKLFLNHKYFKNVCDVSLQRFD